MSGKVIPPAAERICRYPELPSTEDCVVLVDKPKGWTSFDVVRKLRRLLHVKKIGHAGTLDPMATGLLICLLGRATKRMEHFMGLPKTYEGVLRLGEATPSYDADSEVVERKDWRHLTSHDLEAARKQFRGDLEQIPPMFSAVKVGGERLYKKARRGEEVERKPRRITIYDFDLLDVAMPDVTFRVRCSKGTYVRSLAHDFGAVLGVGAHLTALRRTAIGEYDVADAWRVEALESAVGGYSGTDTAPGQAGAKE
ncbi:MAG TPA: tRNA pseudouridine(55) synthase TruB [Rhodothermales bacterium]|nr:tRNA pseudouridine(55) synthase TruB [Rhodothermales bacterium]